MERNGQSRRRISRKHGGGGAKDVAIRNGNGIAWQVKGGARSRDGAEMINVAKTRKPGRDENVAQESRYIDSIAKRSGDPVQLEGI